MNPKLSPRQQQLVTLVVGEGVPLKAACAQIKISWSTGRCYMRKVYERYGVTCMGEFIHLFVDKEKLPPAA